MIRGVVLVALAAAVPWTAQADSSCQGRLSGSVKGSFTCAVSLTDPGDGEGMFVIQALGPIEGVPSYAPGAFRVPLPLRTGTLTLDELGMGRASVAAEGGTLYTATKTSGQRGEVTLVLRSLAPSASGKGAWVAHGTYRARLVPAGSGKQGEVLVEVTF